MSLDDIWNDPIADVPTKPAPIAEQSPLKRPHQSLFLPGSSDDEQRAPKRVTPAPPPSSSRPNDVDALFEDIDREEEGEDDLRYKPLAPALDLAKLAKEAEARYTTSSRAPGDASKTGGGTDQTNKDGNKGTSGETGQAGKTGRKPLPKLDEERLVGPDGFPLLIQEIKRFVPKGKGHEHADLGRLLQVYQFWTHRMFPKTSFKDTVGRVEKLCHSKRMQVQLSVWRDDFKGISKETRSTDADDPDVIDLTEPTPITTEDDNEDRDDKDDSETPPKPLFSPMRTSTLSVSSGNGPSTSMDVDDDASLWDALEDPRTLVPDPPQSTPPPSAVGGDDQDAWDVVDEIMMEHDEQSKSVNSSKTWTQIPLSGVNLIPLTNSTTSKDAPRATNDDDWDDMYS